jgi:hypothetical protein
MTGDQADMLRRLKAVLPHGWFADETPALDALLGGLASVAAGLHALLRYVRMQTRIATAAGIFLDLIAQDFFGPQLIRSVGQSDNAFRANISADLLRERGTRNAVINVLTDLTGRMPVVFEPSRPADTGAWGIAAAYGTNSTPSAGGAGGWGSLMLPFQCFVTAYRPQGQGVASVTGWGQPAGGWGGGIIEYASLSLLQGQILDADINAAIAGVMPVSSIAWTQISN